MRIAIPLDSLEIDERELDALAARLRKRVVPSTDDGPRPGRDPADQGVSGEQPDDEANPAPEPRRYTPRPVPVAERSGGGGGPAESVQRDESQALIDAAIAAGRVTKCPPTLGGLGTLPHYGDREAEQRAEDGRRRQPRHPRRGYSKRSEAAADGAVRK